MLSFLHNFEPQPIFLSLGLLNIRWYAVFIVLGVIAGLYLTLYLAKIFQKESELVWDLVFYLVLWGFIGARLYEVFLFWPYYQNNLLQIFQIWKGGLAIHGALIAGILVLWWWTKMKKTNFWHWAAILSPGLALGQAIGRFGNWFNQELFGEPTNLPWKILISANKRPPGYEDFSFFHPTFLYESLGLLILATTLFFLIKKTKSLSEKKSISILFLYLTSASLLRFFLEFIKIDPAPLIFSWRWPQFFSFALVIITITAYLIYLYCHEKHPSLRPNWESK
ncbi:MAG: prolipoprotein diacylglyceryl transferase [Patescibacteria group bacterium]|nr:prolipoprotein diacylglyceryl transferase [Patescibacteria group bacterium]MDD3435265.1 prolipoprotein diacylglyceryl transferase [Patescibacteria group bacterium]MDD4466253.1 prolipoprotein diacylglyceryl transferase [Patescibacteria group bacterium]